MDRNFLLDHRRDVHGDGPWLFFLFILMCCETDDVILTPRLHLYIPHRGGTQQAYSWSNQWPFPDGCFDSEHYSPFVVDVSLFVLCGTQSA